MSIARLNAYTSVALFSKAYRLILTPKFFLACAFILH